MPIEKKWSTLIKAEKDAPTDEGIYEFGLSTEDGNEVIYIGKGESDQGIRGRIMAHIGGSSDGNKCVYNMIRRHGKNILVRWKECGFWGSASGKEKDHFRIFYNTYGDIPRCNKKNEMRRRGLGALLDELFG